MSKWADLPHDILIEIIRRLSIYDDFVIFAAVYKSWQNYTDIYVYKCVLSRNPWSFVTHEYDCDCIIMVIYSNYHTLAFTRPGNKAWINIKSQSRCFDDLALYKGKFYAIDCHGKVFVCHINDDIAFTEPIAFYNGTEDFIPKYIVESSGDLLLVSRRRGGSYLLEELIEDNPIVTIGFTIVKLECSTEVGSEDEYKWVNVDGLGDQALFVGGNSSVCLSASRLNGWKANSIYFTDDNREFHHSTLNGGGYDMGVFSLEDGSIKQHYQGKSLSFLLQSGTFNLHLHNAYFGLNI
ncbi:hypothetical protein ACB092_11G235500 [Castanea dentata]